MPTPRLGGSGFFLSFKYEVAQKPIVYIPVNDTKPSFKPSNLIKLEIKSVDKKGLMTLCFAVPMKISINPLYTEAGNDQTQVIDVITTYLKLKHQQYDVLQREINKMPKPTYTVVDFDGI